MFIVSRFEQRIEYFWTGYNWSTFHTKAKKFTSISKAKAAETGVYIVTITFTNIIGQ